MADKHIITFGIQSPIFQIVNDGIANYGEQRQCINLLCFLLCIGDQLLVPVQIFEFQCADVSRPHTKKDRQKKHRIISFSNRIATVNNGQQLPHFFWAPCFGDIFFNVDFGPWNTWR